MPPDLSTGLPRFDKKIGGLQPRTLTILAGRPSMGATRLAINIAQNVARQFETPRPQTNMPTVLLFSNEHSADAITKKFLAAQTGISPYRFDDEPIDDREFELLSAAAQKFEELPLFLDDTKDQTIEGLLDRANRHKRQHEIGLIVVDALQKMKADRVTGAGFPDYSLIVERLKLLAQEWNIPIIVTSSVSRTAEENEGAVPVLLDLAEYGEISRFADTVAFMYRDEYFVEREEPYIDECQSGDEFRQRHAKWHKRMDDVAGLASIIIAFQSGGSAYTVPVRFDAGCGKFSDLSLPT